jgi:hypothetical protein
MDFIKLILNQLEIFAKSLLQKHENMSIQLIRLKPEIFIESLDAKVQTHHPATLKI